MIRIASIVEGDSEVVALPVLLQRLTSEWSPAVATQALQPIRVKRDRFLNKEDEFRRQLLLAAEKCGVDGWILVLLDADDDCPAELGPEIVRRAQAHIAHRRFSVVLAKREFEAWFIASARSLDGVRGFSCPLDDRASAEDPRDAKGWMRERMASGTYRPILDQPAFTSRFDLTEALDHSHSFRKLRKEWDANVTHAGIHRM